MIKRISNLLSFAIVIISLYSCSSSRDLYTYDEINELIEQRFDDSLFAHAHWGVLRNADRMFMPASNEKIPTTASALITLGPEYRYETKLYYSGEIIDSVLKGDLIVQGNGDPTYYLKFYDDPRQPFFIWADNLKELGIKEIEGNIIGDDNAFDDKGYGMGWAFDGLDVWYSAESGALQFNENYIDIKIIPPLIITDSVKLIPNIASNYFEIINNTNVVDTGRNSIRVDRQFNTNKILVSGNIVIGSDTLERSPSISNPTQFYVTVLKETFVDKGIKVQGDAIDCDDLDGWEVKTDGLTKLLTHSSPPLKDILKGLMKRSQNMYAETMVKTMGLQEKGIGSFREGKKVVEEVLSSFGIESDTYAYRDGSGLSRYNFISPNQIVKILKGMRKSEHWEIWKDLFPIAGIDGTLKYRMRGTKAEGNVRAKTGTISNVRGLSGYVTTAAGEEIVFSFLINGHLKSSRDTELITDSVLSLIADYPFKRSNYLP